MRREAFFLVVSKKCPKVVGGKQAVQIPDLVHMLL